MPVDAATGLPTGAGARHCNSEVSLDDYIYGNQDFNWRIVEAVNDNASAISIQPFNYFFDQLGIVAGASGYPSPFALGIGSTTAGRPPDDLSWSLVPGLQNANLFSLQTQSKDPRWAGLYATYSSAVTVPCAYNSPRGDLVLAAAGAALAGNGSALTQTFVFFPAVGLRASIVWTTDHHDAQNSGG
jgi:hypothetical protein